MALSRRLARNKQALEIFSLDPSNETIKESFTCKMQRVRPKASKVAYKGRLYVSTHHVLFQAQYQANGDAEITQLQYPFSEIVDLQFTADTCAITFIHDHEYIVSDLYRKAEEVVRCIEVAFREEVESGNVVPQRSADDSYDEVEQLAEEVDGILETGSVDPTLEPELEPPLRKSGDTPRRSLSSKWKETKKKGLRVSIREKRKQFHLRTKGSIASKSATTAVRNKVLPSRLRAKTADRNLTARKSAAGKSPLRLSPRKESEEEVEERRRREEAAALLRAQKEALRKRCEVYEYEEEFLEEQRFGKVLVEQQKERHRLKRKWHAEARRSGRLRHRKNLGGIGSLYKLSLHIAEGQNFVAPTFSRQTPVQYCVISILENGVTIRRIETPRRESSLWNHECPPTIILWRELSCLLRIEWYYHDGKARGIGKHILSVSQKCEFDGWITLQKHHDMRRKKKAEQGWQYDEGNPPKVRLQLSFAPLEGGRGEVVERGNLFQLSKGNISKETWFDAMSAFYYVDEEELALAEAEAATASGSNRSAAQKEYLTKLLNHSFHQLAERTFLDDEDAARRQLQPQAASSLTPAPRSPAEEAHELEEHTALAAEECKRFRQITFTHDRIVEHLHRVYFAATPDTIPFYSNGMIVETETSTPHRSPAEMRLLHEEEAKREHRMAVWSQLQQQVRAFSLPFNNNSSNNNNNNNNNNNYDSKDNNTAATAASSSSSSSSSLSSFSSSSSLISSNVSLKSGSSAGALSFSKQLYASTPGSSEAKETTPRKQLVSLVPTNVPKPKLVPYGPTAALNRLANAPLLFRPSTFVIFLVLFLALATFRICMGYVSHFVSFALYFITEF